MRNRGKLSADRLGETESFSQITREEVNPVNSPPMSEFKSGLLLDELSDENTVPADSLMATS